MVDRKRPNIKIINCFFGACKGDAVNCQGGIDPDGCKANILATAATGAVAGPFTSPTYPQRVVVKYRRETDTQNWDGGSFTTTGTGPSNEAVTETIPAATKDTLVGYRYFKTVTGITKNGAPGSSTAGAHVGYAYEVRDVLVQHCVFDGFEYASASPLGYGTERALPPSDSA